MAIVPSSSGTPTIVNSKKPNSSAPASSAASETMTFTGEPVRASIEPAWAANASGIISCDDGIAQPDRRHHHDRDQRGNGAVDADDRRQQRARAASSARAAGARLSPARAINCWPGPCRDARRVERLADDEERGDEQHRRVAEPGQRLVEVEHIRRPQRQGRADRDDLDGHDGWRRTARPPRRARGRRSCCRPRRHRKRRAAGSTISPSAFPFPEHSRHPCGHAALFQLMSVQHGCRVDGTGAAQRGVTRRVERRLIAGRSDRAAVPGHRHRRRRAADVPRPGDGRRAVARCRRGLPRHSGRGCTASTASPSTPPSTCSASGAPTRTSASASRCTARGARSARTSRRSRASRR